MVPSKHNIFTHFPEDRNCDMCLKTKMTWASCRRRTGTVVPRAEIFGVLTTADHKVLSEGCESRHHHRCAVVNKTWLLSGFNLTQVKRKLLRKHKRSYRSSWSRPRNQKSFTTDNSLEFGKSCEDLSWNHCTSTPHRSETNGMAERTVRRIKEGTSAVLLQSGLDEKLWPDSM